MKYLYGSQNFGYDTDDSDTDWVEIIYPTYDEILFSQMVSAQRESNGGITKVKDVRHLVKWMNKPNLSDIQFLFSMKYIGDDTKDYQWLFDNKDALVRADMWGLYKHTSRVVENNILGKTPKTLTRAAVYTDILRRILNGCLVDNFRDTEYRKIVSEYTKFGLEEILNESDRLKGEIDSLEKYYKQYKRKEDTEILEEAKLLVIGIVKKHL